RQVLLNLVGNAIKFTERGEIVVLVENAAEPAPEGEVLLRFAVTDTGIGIPPEKKAKIFRAFEQEDASTTRRYGGTGLGLTVAARLAALMDGGITVDSVPGQGSTFAFTARFMLQPHPPETTAASLPAVLQGVPALIVDDNATNRHILEEWLRGYAREPTAASGGVAPTAAHGGRAAGRRPGAPLPARTPRRPHAGHRRAGPGRQDPPAGGADRDAPHPADLGGPPRRPDPGAAARDQRHPAQAPPTTRTHGDHPAGDGPPRGAGRAARQPGRGAASHPGRPGGRTAAHAGSRGQRLQPGPARAHAGPAGAVGGDGGQRAGGAGPAGARALRPAAAGHPHAGAGRLPGRRRDPGA